MGKFFFFDEILLDRGWGKDARVEVDKDGRIVELNIDQARLTTDEYIEGAAIPGLANAHSHVFQYVMAGMAEHLGSQGNHDSFWSWRSSMYKLANAVTPDALEIIAEYVYSQMLSNGITSVAEFHYIHNDVDGKTYANEAEMGERLFRAATKAGLRLCLVPVYYRCSGFGAAALESQQRFLCHDADHYFRLLDKTSSLESRGVHHNIGMGVHSIRSSNKEDLKLILNQDSRPIHIHIAEQVLEVKQCLEFYGARPIEWLKDQINLGNHHFLVHATHANKSEIEVLAKTGTNVVLCPTTEANLADGIFPFVKFQSQFGNWCIGTDSNVCLDPFEEIRCLDYSVRLASQKRLPFCTKSEPDSGLSAFKSAWKIGHAACDQDLHSFFGIGQFLDAVILDTDHPLIAGKDPSHWLSSLIYGPRSTIIRSVICSGKAALQRTDLDHNYRQGTKNILKSINH